MTSWRTGTRHLDPPGRGPRTKHLTQRPSHGTRRTSEYPNSWDEGEETTEDTANQATEEASTAESQTEDTESEDSLPELVSDEANTSKDSGYAFLNTPPSTEEEDGDDAEAEERERRRNRKCTKRSTESTRRLKCKSPL